MSTRLFNGYLITGRDPFDLVEDFRRTLPGAMARQFVMWHADDVASGIDLDRFGLPHPAPSKAAEAADAAVVAAGGRRGDRYLARLREDVTAASRGTQRAALDLSTAVTVLRHPTLPGAFLARLFADNVVVTEAFKSIAGVSEYAYWNSSDRPDHVSAQDWEQRNEDWETALGYDSTGSRGLTWTADLTRVVDGYITIEDIMENIPDDGWRARALAIATVPVLPETEERMVSLGNDGASASQVTREFIKDLDQLRQEQQSLAGKLRTELQPIDELDVELF